MTNLSTDPDNGQRRRQNVKFSLDIAEVTFVSEGRDYTIGYQRIGDQDGGGNANIVVPTEGDAMVPEVGDLVVIGFTITGENVVLGIIYPDDETGPEYRRGEKIIGHKRTASNITIDRDGAIRLNSILTVPARRESDPNPEEVPNGSQWYNTTVGAHRAVQDGQIVEFNTTVVE